jgi:hypothetical protein
MLNNLAKCAFGLLVLALLFSLTGGSARSSLPNQYGGETAQSAYDFINSIGVNTHLNYFDTSYGNFSLVKRELQAIGIRHLRDGAHLQNADYNHAVYSRWCELGALGIRFDAVVDPRSRLGPINATALERVDQLAGGYIESFEGANEMDISNLAGWVGLDRDNQQSLFQAVHAMAVSNSIRVFGPSLASASNGSTLGDVSRFMDYGNLHPYPAAKPPSIIFPEQLMLAQEVSSDKQIVITETGYHNALNDHRDQPAISEAAAAKYMPRLFLEDFAHGIMRTYLYEFMDEKADPSLADEQQHWGLLRSDGSEKPAFLAMKNLIDELKDDAKPAKLDFLPYSLSHENDWTHHLLLEKSDGQFILVLWQEEPSYDYRRQRDIINTPQPVVLTLGRTAKSIRTYEPSLQADPIHAYSDVKTFSLDVPDHPLVVDIEMQ